jgi:uncharacterized membrane protein HdeD (DUF308 family)
MDPLAQPSASKAMRDHPIEESAFWAEGPTLIVRKGATLPQRCLLCNEPAERYVKKRFRWHSPWMYLLLLAGLLVYFFTAIFVTRQMLLRLPLCARHARRHRNGTWLQIFGLIGIALGFLVLVLFNTGEHTGRLDPTAALALMVLVSLLVMIVGSFMTATIKVKRITPTHGHFSAGVAFLASCPDHWWDIEDEASVDRDSPDA